MEPRRPRMASPSSGTDPSVGDEMPLSDDDVSSYKLRGAHERCLESRPDRAIVLTPPRAPRATFRRVYSKRAHDALPSDGMLRLRFASPERLPDPTPRVVTHIGRNESTTQLPRCRSLPATEPALRLPPMRACLQQSPPRIRMASAGARPRLVPRVVRHIDMSAESAPVRAATLSARPLKRDVNKDPRRTQSSSVLLAKDSSRNVGGCHRPSATGSNFVQHTNPQVVPQPPESDLHELRKRFEYIASSPPLEDSVSNEESCDSPKSPQFTMHRSRTALAPIAPNSLSSNSTNSGWKKKAERQMSANPAFKWAVDVITEDEENTLHPLALDVVRPEPCRLPISESLKKPPRYGGGGLAQIPKRKDMWKRVGRA